MSSTPETSPEEGSVFLIDKPLEWTSFDAVNKIKKALRIKKLGHAGTLDPLATGLLILCSGKKTKQISEFQDMDKWYTGTIELGKTTPSYDKETEPDHIYPTEHITKEMIYQQAIAFQGAQEQIPPMFSAIKVDGKRMYKLARQGKEIELKSRPIIIHSFSITSIEFPFIKFEINCTKGTYIRSIARDFGLALDSGAYLTELRRTKIGHFDVKNADTIEQYIAKNKKQSPIE